MTKLLSDSEVAAYHECGYHFPVEALSESEVAEFRGKLEDLRGEDRPPDQRRDAPSQPCALHLDQRYDPPSEDTRRG
jgi:hypothetical protein